MGELRKRGSRLPPDNRTQSSALECHCRPWEFALLLAPFYQICHWHKAPFPLPLVRLPPSYPLGFFFECVSALRWTDTAGLNKMRVQSFPSRPDPMFPPLDLRGPLHQSLCDFMGPARREPCLINLLPVNNRTSTRARLLLAFPGVLLSVYFPPNNGVH